MLVHCELAWTGTDRAEPDVLVTIDGDRITDVAAGVAAPEGALRLAGLTVPGFANVHSHAFHRALRGRTQAGDGTFWTWREEMYALAGRLDPDSYHRLARAVYGEMVLAGITCVGEFHYLHHASGGVPYDDPNEMSHALVAAATEAGLRITLLDTCYLHGGFGVPLEGVQLRFGDRDADRWAERVDAFDTTSPNVRVGAAVHSVRAVDPAAITTVAAWAGERPLHVHLSEQPAENEGCRAAHGCTPTELLHRTGALEPNTCAVHATHLTDGDIALLGQAHASVCCCPTTERDLADGIGPMRRLVAAGARLTLGSDSHAVIDPLEEARGVELDERLATLRRGHHRAADLLTAATSHGHAALGWEAGRIETGALADLASIRLDSVRTAGVTAATALEHAVFAATAADVHHVIIGGRVVVGDGEHRSFEPGQALRDALAEVES